MASCVGNKTTQQSYQPLIRQVIANDPYSSMKRVSKYLKHEIIIIDDI